MNVFVRRLAIGCFAIAAVLGAAAWGYSQALVAPQPVDPVVFSGPDIGFRMHARKGDTPVGEFVVRVDGQWKPVQLSYGMKSITK